MYVVLNNIHSYRIRLSYLTKLTYKWKINWIGDENETYFEESSMLPLGLNPSVNPSDSAKSFAFSSTTRTKSIFRTPSFKKVVGSSFPKQTSKLTPWSWPLFAWRTWNMNIWYFHIVSKKLDCNYFEQIFI